MVHDQPAHADPRQCVVTARPIAQHAIRDEYVVCLGGPEFDCHWYSSCDCDYREVGHGDEDPAHAPAQQPDCGVVSWLENTSLYETWAGEYDSAYVDPRGFDEDGEYIRPWPDGLIEWEWTGDYVIWWYADRRDQPSEPAAPGE